MTKYINKKLHSSFANHTFYQYLNTNWIHQQQSNKQNNTIKQFILSKHRKTATFTHQPTKPAQLLKHHKRSSKKQIDLLYCNQLISQSRQKAIQNLRKIRSALKTCNLKKNNKSLPQQIQNTSTKLLIKKHHRHHQTNFNNYLFNKQNDQNQLQNIQHLVTTILKTTINSIKNYIPADAQLSMKLSLFGQLIEEEKYEHISKIIKIIKKEQLKTSHLPKSYQIYLINHYLISILMMNIMQDTSSLQLKKTNYKIYSYIKNQMISQIINEKCFIKIFKIIQSYLSEKQSIQVNQQSLKRTLKRRKQIQQNQKHNSLNKHKQGISELTMNKEKQNQFIFQFQHLYSKAKQHIQQAQRSLNRTAYPVKKKLRSKIEHQHTSF